jgi:hypothetical protein
MATTFHVMPFAFHLLGCGWKSESKVWSFMVTIHLSFTFLAGTQMYLIPSLKDLTLILTPSPVFRLHEVVM